MDIASQAQEKADILPKQSAIAQANSSSNLEAMQQSPAASPSPHRRADVSSPQQQQQLLTNHVSAASQPGTSASSVVGSVGGGGVAAQQQQQSDSAASALVAAARATRSSAQRGVSNLTRSLFRLRPSPRPQPSTSSSARAQRRNFLPSALYSKDGGASDANESNNASQDGHARILGDVNMTQEGAISANSKTDQHVTELGANQNTEELLIDFNEPPSESSQHNITTHKADLITTSDITTPQHDNAFISELDDIFTPMVTLQAPSLEPAIVVSGTDDVTIGGQLSHQRASTSARAAIGNQRSVDVCEVTRRRRSSLYTPPPGDDAVLTSCGVVALLPPQRLRRERSTDSFVLTLANDDDSSLIELAELLRKATAKFNYSKSKLGDDVTAAAVLDSWVNVDVLAHAAHAPGSLLAAPASTAAGAASGRSRSLRGSVSDSALHDAANADVVTPMEEMLVSMHELQRHDVMSAADMFSRMRVRLTAAAAAPQAATNSPQSRRAALLSIAKQNKLQAEKLFRSSKSKIILL